ncbi:MAG: quinate 5-dehydrogenase [Armatimonadota bacterium]
MRRVVSISLGSSKRDKTSVVRILDVDFEISRIGTNGDMKRFAELMVELDGKVDAIGLGGIDRYLWVGDRRYTVRDADRLARIAKVTPVVDGSGVKNTLERRTIEFLHNNGLVDFAQKNVLVVCAVDRFGMAQAVAGLAKSVVYGDLMFNLKIPIPMRSYSTVRRLAHLFLPLICQLPFKWLYPVGQEQEKTTPKYEKYFRWADVIAGDFHIIKRYMPLSESEALAGKVVITNTLTPEDTQMLVEHGVTMVVTSTPQYEGRYYATNVYEGVLVTLLGKRPEEVSLNDYDELLARLEWKPTVTWLSEPSSGG